MEQPFDNIIKLDSGIYFLTETGDFDHFEKDYLEVRKKEGRIFNDEIVNKLPYLPQSNPLCGEWLQRAATQERFCKYLSTQDNAFSILDIGCGNGWFSEKMKSEVPHAKVFALDVNLPELKQAARVFKQAKITFLYGDIFQDIFNPGTFDFIVLNSSVQYFPDIKILLNRLLELLTKRGEIHILDSPFYSSPEAQQEAKKRTINYFSGMDVTDMRQYYHHHTMNSVKEYNYKLLYDPKDYRNTLLRIIGRKINLFPWIRIINS